MEEKKMNVKLNCRIWWPKQLSEDFEQDSSVYILFGWFLPSSSSSLDVVVVPIVASSNRIISNQSDIQGHLNCANGKMTQFLQEKSTFSILGQFVSQCSFNKTDQSVGLGEDCSTNICRNVHQHNGHDSCEENNQRWRCGCHKFDGFLEAYRQSSIENGNWIQLSYNSRGCPCKGIRQIPKLHHIHWGGQLVPSSDVHVIIYDPPSFGGHHFSLKSWGSAEQARKQLKSPMWVNKLYQKQPLPDLETVVFAINSATSAMIVFESCLGPKSYTRQLFLISVLVSTTCHLAAVLLASFSTLIYIILQFFHRLLRYGSQAGLYAVIAKAFSHTWKNIYIRSCQLLYWPIRLQNSGFRSQSNVEYAHRSALHKHSMWSSVAVDVFLGNAIGFALLIHIDTICPWILNLIQDITNNWLRSGCVWLMGVPAGFKLNTELAGILGMVSLNAIQIWSTLLIYMGFLFRYIIKGLALSGILSGLTIPAALIIDMIMLTTLHVSTLHWLISLLYSYQIKSLAALWRLFRGRKWNPLRQRFDSYDYTVKQHVIGSLLFTPLLLLLPTTSVFYIFFTILNTTISFICILIEVIISILHATPYHAIFLWVVKPGRFPSGIWFDIVSSQSSSVLGSPTVRCLSEDSSSNNSQRKKKGEGNNEGAHLLLLFLRTNVASIGQITSPQYKAVFHEVCVFSGSSSASGILTGSRIQAAMQTRLPATMPWMCITCKEYWCLCFDFVLSCLGRS